jgi:hypothetical protein
MMVFFCRDEWERFEQAVREKLAFSGFDTAVIEWICGNMAPRWKNSHLPLNSDLPVAATTEKDAEAVQSAVNSLQAANDLKLLALANLIVNLEIDLYYAINPPSGGTRLRLAA